MNIQRADIKNIESVLFVINESNSDAYRGIIPPEYFKAPIFTLSELMEYFKHMTFYIYKLEDKVVGVAALEVESNEVGHIRFVYILPEHQKKGIGTSLVNRIESEAKKMKLKKLVVPYVHDRAYWAKNFYSKLGYRVIGKVKYKTGEHIFYEKNIA